MEIQCASSGLWNALPDKHYAKHCKIRINSVDKLDSGSEKINTFIGKLMNNKICIFNLSIHFNFLFLSRLFVSNGYSSQFK